ncbi:MAG: hypothetical protein C5B55_01020 [Blastocatellia bacterium]|nr:MAG: hypothetical protein C5B55_01020 [Blastocatellia bacterium]
MVLRSEQLTSPTALLSPFLRLKCCSATVLCFSTDMSFAKLVVIQPGHASQELIVENELISIGRALDNEISLEDDSNISRYHAEIELRGDSFWLIDLGSSNGSTVNDEPVTVERRLADGDLICLGGTTTIDVQLSDVPFEKPEEVDELPQPQTPQIRQPPISDVSNTAHSVSANVVNVPQAAAAPIPTPATGTSLPYIIGAIVAGLIVTAIVGVILYFALSGGCKPNVRIASPQDGTAVTGPISIQVEVDDNKCIDRLIYELDSVKVASSEVPPYQATLNPDDISGLTPGNHILSVVVEDVKGNKSTRDSITLGFNAPAKPSPTIASENSNSGASSDDNSRDNNVKSQDLALPDIKQLCERLAKEIASTHEYSLDLEMLNQVKVRTKEYVSPGFYIRARTFKDVINDSFVNQQGLEKPVGYILAMSRSNFDLSRKSSNADGDGLWRIPLSLAQNAGYMGPCGTSATLSDPDQRCAARVAAAYFKALEVGLFGGDPFLAVACFGMPPNDAAKWRDNLPTDRSSLWNVIKGNEQRERIVRFFAAGIVTENPGRFGLADSSLSNLYLK